MSTIAKRYASALVELAQESNLVELFHEQFQLLQEIVHTSHVEVFLSAPQIHAHEKKQLIENTLATFHPYIIRFIFVCIDKKRTAFLLSICEEVIKLLDKMLNIKRGVVKSPRPMTDAAIRLLTDTFAHKFNAKVVLVNVIEPSLIGGYKIELEDAILDGSLKGQLDELRSYLNSERRTTHGT